MIRKKALSDDSMKYLFDPKTKKNEWQLNFTKSLIKNPDSFEPGFELVAPRGIESTCEILNIAKKPLNTKRFTTCEWRSKSATVSGPKV